MPFQQPYYDFVPQPLCTKETVPTTILHKGGGFNNHIGYEGGFNDHTMHKECPVSCQQPHCTKEVVSPAMHKVGRFNNTILEFNNNIAQGGDFKNHFTKQMVSTKKNITKRRGVSIITSHKRFYFNATTFMRTKEAASTNTFGKEL